MSTIQIGKGENTFVIFFGTGGHRVNAYTLASALVGIADAAKAANASINPGYEIEIVVEALLDGSFKASLRAIYNKAHNIFDSEPAKAITYSIIGAFIYQHTLAPDQTVIVNTSESEVVIEQGDTKIVIPREIHDAIKVVEKSPSFRKGISDAMRAIEADPDVNSLGFTEDSGEKKPPIEIPRERFVLLTTEFGKEEPGTRELVELTDLQILRAQLGRSRKLWQFGWNGMRISAPVSDEKFYDEFFSRRITIAPGDVLRVRLKVKQRLDPDLGVFLNASYEVTEVIDHIPRSVQAHIEENL